MKAVNLLPREQKETDAQSSTGGIKLFVFGGLSVVVVALGTGFFVTSHHVQSQRAQLANAKAELATLEAHGGKQNAFAAWVNRAQSTLSLDRSRRADALAYALSKRVAWDRVLRRLSLVIPNDIWLSSLNGNTPSADDPAQAALATVSAPPSTATTATTTTSSPTSAVPVTPAAPPTPTGLTLEGYAYSQDGVARLLSRLQVVPDLTNVQLQSSKVTSLAGRDVVQFTILADVRRLGDAS